MDACVQANGVHVNRRDADGYTMARVASIYGHSEVLHALVRARMHVCGTSRHRRRHVHCAGAQNDRLSEAVSEAVILSTGAPILAQWTCRRRCRYVVRIILVIIEPWH